MNSYPNFSVSVCVYSGDDPDHFDDALWSVIDQTVPPAELILVVDGPIPEMLEAVIEKYRFSLEAHAIQFKVIYLPHNMGHGEARRRGIESCSYDYVALMDADDLSVNDRFERQLCFLAQHPSISIVGGVISEFVTTPDSSVGKRIVPEFDSEIKAYMRKRCPMNQVTVMFKRTDVSVAGGYLDWYCDEDYYLWIRMALLGMEFANLPDTLVNVRVGEDMYSRRGGIRYFKSEAKLQGFMLKKGMISLPRYLLNVAERLVLQVLMPNRVRGWVFRKFARETN